MIHRVTRRDWITYGLLFYFWGLVLGVSVVMTDGNVWLSLATGFLASAGSCFIGYGFGDPRE